MNAIKKPKEVSMFKVGDKVVMIDLDFNPEIFSIQQIRKTKFGNVFYLYDRDDGGWTAGERYVRHATPEEIAEGHRIDC